MVIIENPKTERERERGRVSPTVWKPVVIPAPETAVLGHQRALTVPGPGEMLVAKRCIFFTWFLLSWPFLEERETFRGKGGGSVRWGERDAGRERRTRESGAALCQDREASEEPPAE